MRVVGDYQPWPAVAQSRTFFKCASLALANCCRTFRLALPGGLMFLVRGGLRPGLVRCAGALGGLAPLVPAVVAVRTPRGGGNGRPARK